MLNHNYPPDMITINNMEMKDNNILAVKYG